MQNGAMQATFNCYTIYLSTPLKQRSSRGHSQQRGRALGPAWSWTCWGQAGGREAAITAPRRHGGGDGEMKGSRWIHMLFWR